MLPPATEDGTYFTLIGDVVSSRDAANRPALQKKLKNILVRINRELKPALPLEPTLGDEFQGCFDTLSEAVAASLLLRLVLLDQAGFDTRYGLGHGWVTVFAKRRPKSQDGEGWWSARDAVEMAGTIAEGPSGSFTRTCFQAWANEEVPDFDNPGAINAFLSTRDWIVGRMNAKSRSRLLSLLRGRTQSEIARMEKTTQSAISQNLTRSGAYAILAGQRAFEGRTL
ncbi:MAG TPA: SatD family protein [Solirubrobacterales bacterium]|nr:SatD family protein [Solirubrobacterales bacterium]